MGIDWTTRIAEAEAKRDAAKKALTAEDRNEIEMRARVAAIDAERIAEEEKRRDVDLARRLDAMREELGEDALLESLAIDGRADTFIVTHDPKAHAKWERDLAGAATNKKMDRVEITRNYAVAVVVDWNGITDFDATSLHGPALRKHLERNPAIATTLVNATVKLAGLVAEERKS